MTTDNKTPTAVANPARVRRAKETIDTPNAPVRKPGSKSDTVIKLLLRAKGATPVELITATDWQPHSLRAFLSGLRKKGRNITREERKGGGFAYRIIVAQVHVPTASSPIDARDASAPNSASAATVEA